MISKTYPLGSFERYKYVVIMSHMDGGFLLSRHKQRTTWEFQGGHIAPSLWMSTVKTTPHAPLCPSSLPAQ